MKTKELERAKKKRRLTEHQCMYTVRATLRKLFTELTQMYLSILLGRETLGLFE